MTEEQTQQAAPSEVTGSVPPSSDGSSANVTPPAQAAGDAGVPAEYTPNYKFKVMDEEKEFDEWLRPVLKDADTEKKVRELYEKAYGLDYVKPKYEGLKKDYDTMKGTWDTVSSDLKKLGNLVKNQDYGSFFSAFNLKDEDIMRYALERLEYYEMPEDKRKAYDAQAKRNVELENLRQENERLSSQAEEQETAKLNSEIDAAVGAEHVKSLAKAFDARAGKAGAFRSAVVAHAIAQFQLHGKDLAPNEAVESLIQMYGLSSVQAQEPQGEEAAAETAQQPPERKPTLPKNATRTQSTPVKAKVKSLADLRKLQEQAFEDGHG